VTILLLLGPLLNHNSAFSKKPKLSILSLPTSLSISQSPITKTVTIKNNNISAHALTQPNNNTQSTITITKLLAKNLEDGLQAAGSVLVITCRLPQLLIYLIRH
jgi:hypothetical protein